MTFKVNLLTLQADGQLTIIDDGAKVIFMIGDHTVRLGIREIDLLTSALNAWARGNGSIGRF